MFRVTVVFTTDQYISLHREKFGLDLCPNFNLGESEMSMNFIDTLLQTVGSRVSPSVTRNRKVQKRERKKGGLVMKFFILK